jgi:peptidyl-tRNA hydrolase
MPVRRNPGDACGVTRHRHGFAAIDELAHSLDMRWIVHSHRHTNYQDYIEPDIQLVSVALEEAFWLPEG